MKAVDTKYAIGIDIGGSHIGVAIVDIYNKRVLPKTKIHKSVDSKKDASTILEIWVKCIKDCLLNFDYTIEGIGISIPGPFNYDKGISEMLNCNKYETLYGLDLRNFLWGKLKTWIKEPDNIIFINDADSFLLGETWSENIMNGRKIGVTLGTGIGSAFMLDGVIIKNTSDVPENGYVFNLPFKEKLAEDWISTEWFLNAYKEHFGKSIENVKEISEKAIVSVKVQEIFTEFGYNLGTFLEPILSKFKTDTILFGGNICKSYTLFQNSFEACFSDNIPKLHFARDTENASILGAVNNLITKTPAATMQRVTKQHLMPINYDSGILKDSYDVYPSFELRNGEIFQGFKSLAKEVSTHKRICIDGYLGVDWNFFIIQLIVALEELGVNCISFSTQSAFKSVEQIDNIVTPYLGGNDPVFGKLYPGELSDFIDNDTLNNINPDENSLSILYGTGAALSDWDAPLIYLDVPKNEIQFRSRAEGIFNLGADYIESPKKQYKRMFYVDWPVLNKHKESVLNTIDYIVDTQQLDDISWSSGDALRGGLLEMSKSVFRVRPWFEPGIWGGDWIKKNIDGLAQDVVNYAWSFEFIVPENGIVFSKNGVRLEVSFDMLMYSGNEAILGDATKVFGNDFPIRFDFLDTFNGQNLSLQCHPTTEFIKEQFSEKFTQDETYYMLDAGNNAEVYLGFQEDIDKVAFNQALENSKENGTIMDVKKYVQVHPAKKHDLFLIPNGTIHCSGKDALVLEISSTPYIYTFKLYDWMRKDLDGNPRPLNIPRGMENLNFDCKGAKVQEDYISKQQEIERGTDWKTIHLSTHPKHFYSVFRLEFHNTMEIATKRQCHILSLVEGSQIKIITEDRSMIVNYSETFVIPSDAKNYQLINLGNTEAKVIQSFVKPEFCNYEL
jgi:predicted NBD/HSP70 family sugar kinase/mannose-6-phosphate isomerase class I